MHAARRIRGTVALLASFSAVVFAGVTVRAHPAFATVGEAKNTLFAGHGLVGGTANDVLRSRSGEFWLTVSTGEVELDQYFELIGPKRRDVGSTGVWHRDNYKARPAPDRDHTVLRLLHNGNLVLRTHSGRVLWSTHTAGTGSHNRLVVRDTGNLVMLTRADKLVWASRTTRVALGAGDSLLSGQHMVNRWDSQFVPSPPVYRMIMQRNGNLVFECGRKVEWSSHTHSAGSQLDMQKNGNLVIRGPHGHRQWSTRTRGHYDHFDLPDVFSNRNGTVLWQPPIPYKPGC